MKNAGVHLLGFHSLCFELMKTSEHPLFKKTLPIITDWPEESLETFYLAKL